MRTLRRGFFPRAHALVIPGLALLACGREPIADAPDATMCPPSEGPLEEVAHILAGPDLEGFAGTAVAGVGDIDGDGAEELVVSESWPGGTAPPSGRVFLACSPVVGDFGLGNACATVQPPDATASFGHAVAGVGDWDGDGVGDFIVGDPGEPTARYEGAAFVVSGGAALEGTTEVLLTIVGTEGPGRTGFDLTTADLDGSGVREVIVGSYRGAFGYSEGASGVVSVEDAEIGVTGSVFPFFEADDLDGDGYTDLVVPHASPYGFAVYRGPILEMRASTSYEAWIDPGERILPALAVTGDLDGDDLPDIVVGGSRLDSGSEDAGRIYVFGGWATGARQLSDAAGFFAGENEGDDAGWALAAVGDLTGDGAKDLIVGAIGVAGNGGAYVVSGPVVGEMSLAEAGFLLATREPSLAGWSVAGLLPEDDGECAGVIIGAPGANAAFVYRGGGR